MNLITVNDLSVPELDVFARLREPQLYHYYEPAPGLFLAEGELVAERALDAGYEPVSVLADGSGIETRFREVLDRVGDVPVYAAPYEVIKDLTGYSLTGGFLCAMRRRPLPSPDEICANAGRIAVLERVTNPTNVGAIVRSAAALSVDAVLFAGNSCDPLCRRAIRVSMGTVFQIPWTRIELEWPSEGMAFLKSRGFQTIAMALTEKTRDLGDESLVFGDRAAMLFGSEGNGLLTETIDACDVAVKIPMRRGVDSLNVAAASAVAFWEFMKH
ncbi:MAG: RNA methyltransferase [Lachnospiraceae bacterium]|nr:RNA methyltransferase [Lachnospiraceae bacterium]